MRPLIALEISDSDGLKADVFHFHEEPPSPVGLAGRYGFIISARADDGKHPIHKCVFGNSAAFHGALGFAC